MPGAEANYRRTKQMRDLDDDSFDENGVLRDGHVFKVSQRMLDNVQRSVAQHFQQQRPKNSAAFPRPNRGLLITDAWGGTVGLHRPGWRIESSGNIGDQLAFQTETNLFCFIAQSSG
jgi:hypothetical protein